ncbi:hypothetical protein D9M69_416510 [compost metagenome]
MPLPDEVAQVIVKPLARRDPEQFQLQPEPLGQGIGKVDIHSARLAVFLEAVGREVLVDGHPQHARIDDVVKGAHLCLRQGQAQQPAQQNQQAHGDHSSTCTLSR